MDERSRHPYPDGAHREQSRAQPWPGGQIAEHALQAGDPRLPTVQQFQFESRGFVLPGAAGGQQPLSAHNGIIGTPMLGHAPPAPAPMPSQMQAAAPQAWAFPTPHGMQLVQTGAVALATAAPHHGVPAATLTALPGGGAAAATRRRVRWETIVPIAALACVLGAAGVFIAKFDQMTGRGGAARTTMTSNDVASKDAASGVDAAAAEQVDPGEAAAATADASTLMDQGRFDEAAQMLRPFVDAASPDPTIVALHGRIDAAGARNSALLARLTKQRAARQWTRALITIGQLQTLRPLSPTLIRQRTQARAMVRTARTVAQVRALVAQGRYSAASTLLDQALQAGPNAQLEAVRERVASERATPSARPVAVPGSGPTARPQVSGGGASGGVSRPAPMPSSRPGAIGSAQPPANVAPGAMPPRPDAPNPITTTPAAAGGVSGQPAVTGGAGASAPACHTGEGMTGCH